MFAIADEESGAVMTDVGLAQRQLADNELPPTAPYVESGLQDEGSYPVEGEGNGVDYGYNPGPYQVDTLPEMHNPVYEAEVRDIGSNTIQPVNNATNSLSNYDYTQSDASYNIFESMKHSTDNPTSNIHIDNEQITYKSPRRSKSMQPIPYSPHDTEPFSSMISPKLSRSRTDNGTSSHSHSARGTGEEYSVPDVAEMPPAKKKRGRPKKQENQEDNEPSKANESTGMEQNNKLEKRKPGRPPSNAKARKIHDGQQEELSTIIPEEEVKGAHPGSNEIAVLVNGGQEVPVDGDEMQLVEISIPKDSATISNYSPVKEIGFAQPAKPAKEPKKKKKLKRGKTTSVTLQKTYESDVEDDVIWVDERPVNFDAQQKPTLYSNHAEPSAVPNGNTNGIPNSAPAMTVEEIQDAKLANSAPSHTEPPPPAPKKRGRKRKKTSEQIATEETMPESSTVQEPPQPDNPSTIETTDNRPLDTSNETHPENLQSNLNLNPEESNLPTPSSSPTKQPQQETLPIPEPAPKPQPDPNSETHAAAAPTTPQKQNAATAPNKTAKTGPDKHSPISGTSKVPYRVGLSRRARIAPLLKVVRR